MKDLEALEPDFHNSLLWIRDNDPEPLDLTFTVEEVKGGRETGREGGKKERGRDKERGRSHLHIAPLLTCTCNTF